MAALPPPPLDSPLGGTKPGPVWARWLQQLWDSVRSNLTATTRCYARATRITSNQSIPNAAYTVVEFNSTELDSRSAVSGSGTSSWRFTVPTGHDGIYLVAATITLQTSAGAGINLITLFKNGSEHIRLAERAPGTTAKNSAEGTTLVSLVAGDYIDLRVYQDSGAARDLTGAAMSSHVSILRMVTDI